jgi:hypothetical protein
LCRKKIVPIARPTDSYRDFGGHAQLIQHLLKNKNDDRKEKMIAGTITMLEATLVKDRRRKIYYID